MRVRPVAVPLTVALCLPVLAGMYREALLGKWSATVTADEGAGKEHADTLTFTNGYMFASDELAKQGFGPASYADRFTPTGAAATFDVTLTNKAGDTAHWQASEAGGQMTGTLVVTPKGGAPVGYAFKAERK